MVTSVYRNPEFSDGEILRSCDYAGITLGEVQYPVEHARATHVHERACIHFLLEGGYTEYQGCQTNECKPLSLSFQPCGHEHSYRCSKTISRSLTIEFEPDWVKLLADYSVILDAVCNFSDGILLWFATRLYNEFRALGPASQLVIEGLALEIAVEISRRRTIPSERKPPAWLKQVEELLKERFAESLTLQEIGRTIRIHPVHLARTFRQHYQCSVGEYVRNLRIESACKQVAHSDMSLSDIAFAAGFSDQSQFTRTFGRIMGMTPGAFRATTRPR
jgi:AraC family transcriptional regulator